jgi:hypothetical protein
LLRLKTIISVCIFSILFGFTSIIKTQTRIVEKKNYEISKKILIIEKDLHETQLDFFYLSSPSFLSQKIKELAFIEYQPMDFSRIYLSYLDFSSSKKKISTLKKNNETKTKKK